MEPSHKPIQRDLAPAHKAVAADPGEVVFHYKDSGKKIAIVESLVGQSGWLLCNRLTISAFETEDHQNAVLAFLQKRQPEYKGR